MSGLASNQSLTPLTYGLNAQGHACLGNLSLVDLALQYGTPLYVLCGNTIHAAAKAYTDTLTEYYPAPHHILYAGKANLSLGLCQKLSHWGIGVDVVSGGELTTALKAGMDAKALSLNGNNKSADELRQALHAGIGLISVDNEDELHLLAHVARETSQTARILLRVCPGIEAHTHDYIKTGQEDTKFGFGLHQLPTVMAAILGPLADVIELQGLHAHIGSQIFDLQPYQDLAKLMLTLYFNIRKHYGITLPDLNLGGGLGISYTHTDDPPAIATAVQAIAETLKGEADKLDYPLPRLLLEPGRSLVASAGITLYTVGSQKIIPPSPTFAGRHFVAVDGGMGDNIRPALYQAHYTAVVANKATQAATQTVTLVGKYCETGDKLIESLAVPPVEARDTVAVFGTGAYNDSMASTYNRMPRPACVWVENNSACLLTRRETVEDLLRRDQWFTQL
ncbi:MAG: diaminopimelate decarboxylase [Vampirovibrionales bacterium]|nr:diaminopimelate decarboxylase [Vampirovibrionales bacterium]